MRKSALTLVARVRHLASIIGATVQRDLHTAALRAHDESLVGSSKASDFPTVAPMPPRRLPALDVPMLAPAQYGNRLLAEIEEIFENASVPVVSIPSDTSNQSILGVRNEDWDRALFSLQHSPLRPLIGLGRPKTHPSRLAFTPRLNVDELASHPIAYIFVPAVHRRNGEIVRKYGFECAIRIERWESDEAGRYSPPAWNSRTALLASNAFMPPNRKANSCASDAELAPLTEPALFDVTFPIDVVYTWVDGTDPRWLERKRTEIEAFSGEKLTEDAAANLRFIDHDELRYSLRSLEQYAPWVRHIYIVTDNQVPSWLRVDHPRVTVVDHSEIAPPGSALPTYNSHAIEANLHRIDGLSEHFLYLNDDMFLSSHVSPSLFFAANGIASIFLSRAQIAPGPPVPGESASDSAGKNARTLVQATCGRRVNRKLFHAPYALNKVISCEIESMWPELINETRASTFRRISDVTLAGSLHLNYAFATARAVTHGIRYRYVDVGQSTAASELDRLYRDRDSLQVFCLNESSPELDFDTVDLQVREFLARRFPDVSSFERI